VSQSDATRAVQDLGYDLSHQYRVVEITAMVITRAIALAQVYALRGYDAVQLAAALVVHNMRQTLDLAALELVSADRDLNAAAMSEGLPVNNPNDG
jgi:predicted nucleic acid-binding protein